MILHTRQFGLTFFLIFALVVSAGAEQYLSPSAVAAAPGGKTLYISEFTAGRVAVFDIAAGKVARRIELGAAPRGITLSADGATLYATVGSLAGEVLVIETASGKIAARIAAGHTPTAPVLSRAGKTLYVCNRFNNNVSVIDLAAGKETGRIRAVREPVAAAITPDGATLLVANLLPDGPATSEVVAAAVSLIDLKTQQVRNILLPNGSTGLLGICLSPDGKFGYVAHTLGRYQLPTTQLERGWMNTNALSIIDVGARKALNTVLLDDVDFGAANPWGVACTADGKQLCVTHAGTHELSVIDRAGLHDKLARLATGERVNEVSVSAAGVPSDLSFLTGLRQRIKLTGRGPRGLAVAGGKAYAAEYFSDSLAVVDLNTPATRRARSIALGPQVPMTPRRKGELFFNDASLCFQQWQSCGSCHPDARVDGLNWDLLNDGIGNPKNVRSMLLAHKTPPAMSLGVREDAEHAVRSGIKFIQFAVRPEEDAAAIDEYLKALQPVPSPHLTREGKLSAAAARGKTVYKNAGCGSCHSGAEMTSKKTYDVGTSTENDSGAALDTPTLIEVWRTAPYLHDGRSRTMLDVLTRDNSEDKHGATRGLSKQGLRDLAEYVLSQ
jgi:YVTN family beta-propeller protein